MSRIRVQQVDARSDEVIYRAVAPELMGFAIGLVGPTDAADVLSSAVVKAMSSRSWRHVENPRAYLYQAVMNEAKTWKRRAAQRKHTERLAAHTGTVELPSFQPEVRVAVDRLPLRQRAVILLTYWADFPPVGIAEHLGLSEGSVKRHLARARAALREVLDD